MSLRSTLTALFVIVALCGGGLYLAFSIFSRDSQMRQAEVDFATVHSDEIAAARAQFEASRVDEPETFVDPGEDLTGWEEEGAPDLDDWYAAAGSSDEPFDPAPEDKSYLINDTEPFSDAEPTGF